MLTGGKLVGNHVLILLMVVASAQSLNKASTQACVTEEHGLTIANTPTHLQPSTAEINSAVKDKKLFFPSGRRISRYRKKTTLDLQLGTTREEILV